MSFLKNIYKYSNKTALVTENQESIKYKDLIKFSDNISKNIDTRCLVFLLSSNNLESIVGYLGFLNSNCVISLIDENIDNHHLKRLILNYKPNYIFLGKKKLFFSKNYSEIYSFLSYKLLKLKKKI